jgi:2-polyprenyl-3-methyl-5-hydroxy-6-metoxy-1,4-benzoquinol methylase
MKEAYELYDRQLVRSGHSATHLSFNLKDPRRYALQASWLPLDKNTPILDIGCGFGETLGGLWAAGYRNLTGIDLSDSNCKICRATLPKEINIICDDAYIFLKNRPDHFGLITMFYVLEHVMKEEIVSFLRLIDAALSPGGKLIIKVPNAACIIAPYVLFGDITHQQCFTEPHLSQLMEIVGFSEVEFLVPPYFSFDLWCRTRSWRRPWAGLGLRALLNHLIHSLIYSVTAIRPKPKIFSWEITVQATK